MLKKYFGLFLCLVLLGTAFGQTTAVLAEEDIEVLEAVPDVGNEENYYCYYLDGDATQLVSEIYVPDQPETEYMLKDLMQRLGSKTAIDHAISLLPQEVNINSYELQGFILVIDFNTPYKKMSRVREILVRAGVVKTFIQAPGIDAVRFTVNGEELTDSKGQEIGNMTEDAFVEYSGSADMNEYRFDTLTLYFADRDGEHLVAEERNVYYKRSLQKERVVLEQLAKGPMIRDHYPTVPGNLTVKNVYVSDDICYVNLDNSFVNYAVSGLSEELVVYSVVNSILASCGESRVEISVDGNTEATLGEELGLYRYFDFQEDLIIELEEE